MKIHLLLVFFLAMPLVGRLLSNDSATSVEACDSSASAAADPQPDASQPTGDKTTAAPAREPDSSAPAPAPTKSSDRRAKRARAVNFM